MKHVLVLMLVVLCTACAQTQPDPMNEKAVKVMGTMRNPICRQVGSYLYCNEQ